VIFFFFFFHFHGKRLSYRFNHEIIGNITVHVIYFYSFHIAFAYKLKIIIKNRNIYSYYTINDKMGIHA
jgi:hypothetical protein